ncbi:MAG: circularly permuted type 2 ATP-grasp protein [Opitutaceae bacterium]
MSTHASDIPVEHFRDYRGGAQDAVFDEQAVPRLEYAPIVDVLQGCSRSNLNLRQKRLDRAVDELGLQFSDMGQKATNPNSWRLDFFPLVLPADQWKRISAGVVQRALAFNAYATDLYGPQKILRERVVPHEVALNDPALLRQLSGIEVPHGEYSQFGAFDLVDTGGGNWKVIEHHMGTPFGISHVLQNRRALSEAFPELYQKVEVAPVAGFSTYLLEMLRAQSKRSNPHVLLLTSGQTGQAYFEEAFIARHMGISIAQPGDLLVRESRVFLKTIRGLERVDVIYRRVASSALDPIAVPNRWANGVPGLINVVRKGNVAIVNAPGAGVTDNRALLRYSDRIIQYYSQQTPILKSVETFHLGDQDQRAHVSDHIENMVIKPVQDHDVLWQKCGGKRPNGTAVEMERLAKRFPNYFVAQPSLEPTQMPHFNDGSFSPQAVQLRAYYILGAEPIVLPGGMARLIGESHRTRRLTITTNGLKDVWVADDLVEDSEPKRRPASTGSRFSIGSRVAESLYWAGRYLERAENTARQFNTLEKLRWDQMGHAEQQTYWPLLQSVAAATGQTAVVKLKKPPRDTLKLSNSLLLDINEGASVFACIRSARNGLEHVREVISPECWEVLEEMVLDLRQESKLRVTRGRLRALSEKVVSEVARFNGTAERTLSHDDSWQFYRAGVFFERALGVLSLLEVALPRIVQTYQAKDEESADLTALLRLLGSLDAYRREFRSRAYVDRVARLIILGKSHPSSVSFCLRNLHYAIGTLSMHGEGAHGKEIQSSITALLDCLDDFSITKSEGSMDEISSPGYSLSIAPKQIARELTTMTKELELLHKQIDDVFFNHQNMFAREPTLFELG